MAERRMFSLSVVDTDQFLEMPASAQALYFHLGMRADDEGFVSSPRKITTLTGCAADDLKILVAKKFVLAFPNGLCVITDWKRNNYIQKDRFKPTAYLEEKALLTTKENGVYTFRVHDGYGLDTECVHDGYGLDTQVSIGKVSIDKARVDKSRKESTAPPAACSPAHAEAEAVPTRTKFGEYGWVRLTDEEYHRLSNDLGETEVKRCITYIDESAQSTSNKNKWRDWNLVIRKCSREGWGKRYGEKTDAKNRLRTAADYEGGESLI